MGRKPKDEATFFERVLCTQAETTDTEEIQRKNIIYKSLWVNGNHKTVLSHKTGIRSWAAWCDNEKCSYLADSDIKLYLYMKHCIEQQPATEKRVSVLENAMKTLGLIRKCQPGIPEGKSISEFEIVATFIKSVRAQARQEHEINAEIQCIHGTDRLTVEDQRCIIEACDKHGDIGVHIRAIINIGIATGMRGDDLSRRKYHQLWVDNETLPWKPTPAYLLCMSGRVSKANPGLKVQYLSCIRHKDIQLCGVGALAELVIHTLNQPCKIVATFLDHLENNCDDFRQHRLFWKDPALQYTQQSTDTFRSMYESIVATLQLSSTKTKSVSILRTTGTSRLVREGCDRASLLNWGRWSDSTTADASYICKEPLSALSANAILGGWGPLDAACNAHTLHRSGYDPPQAWIDAITTSSKGAIARDILDTLQKTNACIPLRTRKNLDGVSCINAVLYLAKVFWQDMALRHSVSPVARLPSVRAVITSDAFQKWAIQVQKGQQAPSTRIPTVSHTASVTYEETPVPNMHKQPTQPIQSIQPIQAVKHIQSGIFSDNVATIQEAYNEYYRGFGGKPAIIDLYREVKNKREVIISKKDVQKRYIRRWLPEAMYNVIQRGVAEQQVITALTSISRDHDLSLYKLREAFRLLARHGHDPNTCISDSTVTLGLFKQSLNEWGID